MAKAQTMNMTVTRYHPEQDREPVDPDLRVPYHEDWVVLDALHYIKDHIDGTLSYRWSCRMGDLRKLRHDGQRLRRS